MQKFTVEHAVDFSSGKAVIGKFHVITARERLIEENKAEMVAKMNEARERKA